MRPSNIQFHHDLSLLDYFYDSRFHSVINTLAAAVGNNAQVDVMPDATLKTNRVPTGIAVSAPEEEALLMPHLYKRPRLRFSFFPFELARNTTG